MKKMKDVRNFSAQVFKGVLFTGAQASKSPKKLFFTTSVVFFHFRDIDFNDIFRTFESEMCPNLEQTQPKAPCSQALKQANTGKISFSRHL